MVTKKILYGSVDVSVAPLFRPPPTFARLPHIGDLAESEPAPIGGPWHSGTSTVRVPGIGHVISVTSLVSCGV